MDNQSTSKGRKMVLILDHEICYGNMIVKRNRKIISIMEVYSVRQSRHSAVKAVLRLSKILLSMIPFLTSLPSTSPSSVSKGLLVQIERLTISQMGENRVGRLAPMGNAACKETAISGVRVSIEDNFYHKLTTFHLGIHTGVPIEMITQCTSGLRP